MSECKIEEASASIEMTFEGCVEHGEKRPVSAYIQVHGGLDFTDLANVALGALEETISKAVGDFEPLLKAVKTDWPGMGVLSEAGHEHLSRLMAHQYLVYLVTERAYFTHGVSAFLSLPTGE